MHGEESGGEGVPEGEEKKVGGEGGTGGGERGVER